MEREEIQAFTARVTQASKSELIVILYEMILSEIAEARRAYEKKDMALYDKALKKAQRCVNELITPLNYNYTVSYDLVSLYLYVNKRIIKAIITRIPEALDSAESVLNKLLIGFKGVSREDKSGPVMHNTQQLYAGLTYGKGQLNETYIDSNYKSRGFIA